MVRSFYLALTLFMSSATAWALLASAAGAQVSAETETEAKRVFEEGLALAKSERWGEALSAFRRSAALVPRASTSYNIANALYRLNQPIDGLMELDRYDKFFVVRSNYAAQQRGEGLRDLLEEAVAELRLTVTPVDALVFLDGRLFAASGLERRLRLNPGAHSLRVTHEEYTSSFSELQLERGGRESLTIALEPLTSAPSPALDVTATSVTSTAPRDDRERFVKRPGFWVVIGAIVLVGVGTGVAVAMVRRDDAPQCGTTGDCATTSGLTVTAF